MFLVLLGSFDSLVCMFTNQQDLCVSIIEVFWLDLRPSKPSELFNDTGAVINQLEKMNRGIPPTLWGSQDSLGDLCWLGQPVLGS